VAGLSVLHGIPQELLKGALTGVFLAIWMIGSLMLITVMVRGLSRYLASRSRLRLLDGFRQEREEWFSLRRFRWVRELADEMEIAEMRASVEACLALMLAAGLTGYFGSGTAIYMLGYQFATGEDRLALAWNQSSLVCASVGFLCASLPYFYVRFRVQRKRQRIAYRMIMLVQNLIGHYRASSTIAEIIVKSARTMPGEVQSEWRRLELSLHMQSIEEALLAFTKRLDNEWADDLSDLLLIGAHYGTDLSEPLHHLVSKMQMAKRSEENRLAMVTAYRLGTSFMAGFAIFVVMFNLYADSANYHHYFVDPTGKGIIAGTAAVMFLSMVLVVRSGRKAF
jgi:Flp pilus assembly protein TadB